MLTVTWVCGTVQRSLVPGLCTTRSPSSPNHPFGSTGTSARPYAVHNPPCAEPTLWGWCKMISTDSSPEAAEMSIPQAASPRQPPASQLCSLAKPMVPAGLGNLPVPPTSAGRTHFHLVSDGVSVPGVPTDHASHQTQNKAPQEICWLDPRCLLRGSIHGANSCFPTSLDQGSARLSMGCLRGDKKMVPCPPLADTGEPGHWVNPRAGSKHRSRMQAAVTPACSQATLLSHLLPTEAFPQGPRYCLWGVEGGEPSPALGWLCRTKHSYTK